MKLVPVLLFPLLVAAARAEDVVRLDSGSISGSVTANAVRTYKGIPFASPPVGALRWRAPVALAPWGSPRGPLTRPSATSTSSSATRSASAPGSTARRATSSSPCGRRSAGGRAQKKWY